jgi:hypothetical protein
VYENVARVSKARYIKRSNETDVAHVVNSKIKDALGFVNKQLVVIVVER